MRRLLASVAVTALGLTACAGGSDESKAALADAFESLGRFEAVTQTLSVRSTPESLRAALGDENLSADTAEKILESSVVLSQTLDQDPARAKGEMEVTIGGEVAFEMRTVDETLYLRADVPALLETFGQDPSQLERLARQASQAGLDFVRPAVGGEWIAVVGLADLSRSLGGAPPPSAQETSRLYRELGEIVEAEATVESAGEDEAGEHLIATIPLRPVLTRLIESLGQSGMLPQQMPTVDPGKIPDESIEIDVWVDGGVISQLEFDLTQLAEFGEDFPEAVEELTLRDVFEEWDATVDVPSDAVEVDVQQLLQLMTGAVGAVPGGGGAAPGGLDAGFDCSQLKGAPQEVIELYKKECPELQ